MTVCLSEDIALDQLRGFFREKPLLFLGTGMSCALDARFGMPALRDALVKGVPSGTLTNAQKTEWNRVMAALESGSDLESSLNAANDSGLLRIITGITGSFIGSTDRECACHIANGSAQWPATALLKRLVDTLPESDPVLHVLTPNYDLLLEYACDSVGIPYTAGFTGGVERKANWDAAKCTLRVPTRVRQGGRHAIVCKPRKQVRLYKVHGSLNYFFHRNAVVENNAWMWNPPDFAHRVMITPGLSKYQMLQRYRQELLQSADAAIQKATHFLFLGYGFNDNHLEEYIKRKLITQACHGLIVTRDSNARIEALLADAPNLWLVCKTDGRGSRGSRIFNRQYSDWLSLPAKELWDVGKFTTQILGG